MSCDTPKDVVKSACPFLELPGELRNEIYRHMLADVIDSQELQRAWVYHYPDTEINFNKIFKSRPFMGLCQVNKLIREEFAPLYSSIIKPTVGFNDVAKYLKTFPLEDRTLSQRIEKALVWMDNLSSKRDALPEFQLSALSRISANESGIDITPLFLLDWNSLHFKTYYYNKPLYKSTFNPQEFMHFLLFRAQNISVIRSMFTRGELFAIHIGRKSEFHFRDRDIAAITLVLSPEFGSRASIMAKRLVMQRFGGACDQTGVSKLLVQCYSGGLRFFCRIGRDYDFVYDALEGIKVENAETTDVFWRECWWRYIYKRHEDRDRTALEA